MPHIRGEGGRRGGLLRPRVRVRQFDRCTARYRPLILFPVRATRSALRVLCLRSGRAASAGGCAMPLRHRRGRDGTPAARRLLGGARAQRARLGRGVGPGIGLATGRGDPAGRTAGRGVRRHGRRAVGSPETEAPEIARGVETGASPGLWRRGRPGHARASAHVARASVIGRAGVVCLVAAL